MLDRIVQFISKYNMIEPHDTVVAGVSGGADSVCLLLNLKELQKMIDFTLIAVHVNHCIRGEEADQDQEFVRELCEKLEIPLQIFTVEVQKIAKQQKISVEEAGRKERYRIFENVLSETAGGEPGRIAVAHHMDDQGETILMNMVRGSGLKGMCGMQPVRGSVIRPLLCVRRCEIERYLQLAGQDYQTDSTNFHNDYTRNRLRNHVFPYLEQNVNSHVTENICKMAEVVSEAETYIERQAIAAQCICVSKNENDIYTIKLSLFDENDRIIKKYIIRNVIGELAGKQKDVYKIHIEAVLGLADKQVGSQVDVAYGITAKRGYSEITLQSKSVNINSNHINNLCICNNNRNKPKNIDLDKTNTIFIEGTFYIKDKGFTGIKKAEFLKLSEIEKIIGNDYTKLFDYDRIKFTLQFRTRQTGDYIQIDEKGGKKKLKDYFIDQKVPKDYRDKVLLLADGSSILWIVGFRMSEGYKITEETKTIVQVKIYEYAEDNKDEIRA